MTDEVNAYVAQVAPAEEAIKKPVSKLGGAPVFFEKTENPLCAECQQPMALLAQLRLDDPVQLSQHYTMAYVFMCMCVGADGQFTNCETWDPTAGANRVLLQSAADTMHTGEEKAQLPDYAISWQQITEPNIDASDPVEVPDETWDLISQDTKLAGTPSWVQFEEIPACPECGGKTRYIAQLAELSDPIDGRTVFNFGDAGQGYVFICETECSPRGAAFLWQCA